MTSQRAFWTAHALTPAMLDHWCDARAHHWSRFDSELGYLHADYCARDGLDGSCTTNRMGADGARASALAGKPCRINTYGNSFTHGDQVNDGETWQEYLAAHLQEPLRNFGTGGHGVYQAYRRMLREENGPHAASHVIVNLFEDDHRRNLMSWRWLDIDPAYHAHCRSVAASGDRCALDFFHNTPWDYLVWDGHGRGFTERRSRCPRLQDLRLLCDPEWLAHAFADDLHAQVMLARRGVRDYNRAVLVAHAEAFGVPFRPDADDLPQAVLHLFTTIGLHASRWVLERVRAFTDHAPRRLLLVLSYGMDGIVRHLEGREREDGLLRSALATAVEPVVDLGLAHAEDYRDFACTPEQYARRYYVGHGHYNPRGNHFCAFAMKDAVVRWLEPRPVGYQDRPDAALAQVASALNGGAVAAARPG